jgi:predicted Zn finger-like uncharacterized protein
MMINCVSCDSKFHLGNSDINAAGSKVTCSKCHETFIVLPPDNNTESCPKNSASNTSGDIVTPRAKQSRLDDSIAVESNPTEMTASDGEYEKTGVSSMEPVEPEEDFEKVGEDIGYPELPDLSEIEQIVDSILYERDHLNSNSPLFQDEHLLTGN